MALTDTGWMVPERKATLEQVDDGLGGTVTQEFMITVTAVNLAPVITSNPLTTGQIGQRAAQCGERAGA